MRIGIFGGRGRLGSAIAARIAESGVHELAWAVDMGEVPPGPADVAVDASLAPAVAGHVDWAVANSTDLVIAATGWAIPDLAGRVGGRIGVLVSPNLSLGVALVGRFAAALGAFAALDPESGIAVFEHHHGRKADAPSGTAKALAEAVISGGPRFDGWVMDSAAPGKVCVSSMRAGFEVGYHEVVLDAEHEVIAVSHRARDRALFAAGALRAAAWLHGKKGVFTMDDLAASALSGQMSAAAGNAGGAGGG